MSLFLLVLYVAISILGCCFFFGRFFFEVRREKKFVIWFAVRQFLFVNNLLSLEFLVYIIDRAIVVGFVFFSVCFSSINLVVRYDFWVGVNLVFRDSFDLSVQFMFCGCVLFVFILILFIIGISVGFFLSCFVYLRVVLLKSVVFFNVR